MAPDAHLRRELGLLEATLSGVGIIISAGEIAFVANLTNFKLYVPFTMINGAATSASCLHLNAAPRCERS